MKTKPMFIKEILNNTFLNYFLRNQQQNKSAFSLMEMLIVMLIVALVLAISAPMITKKHIGDMASYEIWLPLLNGNTAYNPRAYDKGAIIGGNQTQLDTEVNVLDGNLPKLTINTKASNPHLGFMYENTPTGVIHINKGISIGNNPQAPATNTIAIGNKTLSYKPHSISLGTFATAKGDHAISIGGADSDTNATLTTAPNTIAIGYKAQATHANSTALGFNTKTTEENQIVLGDTNANVYIPGKLTAQIELKDLHLTGNLIVDGNTVLGYNTGSATLIRSTKENKFGLMKTYRGGSGDETWHGEKDHQGSRYFKIGEQGFNIWYDKSDKRLKNILEENLDAMDKIDKLKVYNYTFKNDGLKIPHVGVIAQDLQKIFPNAVRKDENGYLEIRKEDIFFAMVNALKELNTKIVNTATTLSKNTQNITHNASKLKELEENLKIQNEKIKSLENEVKELRKIINKITQ